MKGHKYYKDLDFSKPVGTHRYVDNIKSRRELSKVALVAMARINSSRTRGNHPSLRTRFFVYGRRTYTYSDYLRGWLCYV